MRDRPIRRAHDGTSVFSGLEPSEIDQLMEWYCYTKPIGPSIRVVATSASPRSGFCVVAAGNQPGPAENPLPAPPPCRRDTRPLPFRPPAAKVE